MSFTVLTKGVT